MAQTNSIQQKHHIEPMQPCCEGHGKDSQADSIQKIALPAIQSAEEEREKASGLQQSVLAPEIAHPFQAKNQTGEPTLAQKIAHGNFDPAGAAVQLGVDVYSRLLQKAQKQKREIFQLENELEKHLSFSEMLRLAEKQKVNTEEIAKFIQEPEAKALNLSNELLKKLSEPGVKLTKDEIEQIKHRVQRQIRILERTSNRKAQEITYFMEDAKGMLNALKKIVERCDRLLELINRNMGK